MSRLNLSETDIEEVLENTSLDIGSRDEFVKYPRPTDRRRVSVSDGAGSVWSVALSSLNGNEPCIEEEKADGRRWSSLYFVSSMFECDACPGGLDCAKDMLQDASKVNRA